MTWINPKTDWNSETYINASDFNRIEGNLTHIHGLFEQLFPSMAWSQYPTQATDDVPYTYKWVIVEGQLENLNKKSYDLNIGNRKTFSENGHYIEYNELNRIENACLTLYNRMTAQIANNTAPTIAITSNIIDWTSSASYDVTGKVTSNGNGISDAYLYYGNNSYRLTLNSSGEFTKRITLQPGVNNLSVRSRDLSGNPRFYEFTKKYDSTLPVITITSAQSTWSTTSAYTVTGKVADAESGIASATITTSTGVSETALTLNSSGNFSYPITLNNTDNTITIKATNGAGRQSTTTFHAYYDTTAPTISFTSSSATTVNPTYTLQGRVTDSQSGVASVTVNGSAQSFDANGYFSRSVTLSEGNNTFTVVATDNAGRTNSSSLTINLANQKNNASYNWSQTDRYPTTGSDYNDRVIIGGVAYNIRRHAWASGGDSQIPVSGNINSTIPLPKGISSLSGSITGSGWTNTGTSAAWNGTITLHDNTTNQNLASVSFSGGRRWTGGDDASGSHQSYGTSSATYSWGVTAEQSLHDLVLIVTGSASGQSYQYAGCETGMAGVPTFTWY